MSKPRVDPTFGISSVDVLILTERHHRRPGSHVPYKSLVELRAIYMFDSDQAPGSSLRGPTIPAKPICSSDSLMTPCMPSQMTSEMSSSHENRAVDSIPESCSSKARRHLPHGL